MSGLDDLIGGLTKKSGSGGGGIDDLLGGATGSGGSAGASASSGGLDDLDEAADVLAAVVPQVVNGLTPDGHVPSDDELEALLRQLQPAAS